MHIKKKQHYVPIRYLKRFSSGNCIWVYDKIDRKVFNVSPTNIACEKYFYDIPGSQLKKFEQAQMFEDHLQYLETEAYNIMDQLDPESPNCIRQDDSSKRSIAYYITVQIIRTARFRREYITALKGSAYAILLESKKWEQEETLRELKRKFPEEYCTSAYLNFILSPRDNIIDELCEQIWLMCKATDSTTYFTSDNPIIIWDPTDSPLLSSNRILGKGAEIIYPISPKYAVGIFERTLHKELEYAENRMVMVTEEFMEDLRHRILLESERFIFSQYQDFEVLTNIIRNNPDILSRPELKFAKWKCNNCGLGAENVAIGLYYGRLGVVECMQCSSSNIELVKIIDLDDA